MKRKLNLAKRIHRTIQQPITFEGIGVHSGAMTKVTLRPSADGIYFRKRGENAGVCVAASLDNVTDTVHGTTLGSSNVSFAVVEHLLAALYSLEIDGVEVILEGDELPIMDGSALPFVKILDGIRIVEEQPERVHDDIVIKYPLNYEHKGSFLAVFPSPEFTISYFISYKDYPELTQMKTMVMSPEYFVREIAPARTFAFLEWVEPLQKQGLIKGGSLENSLVYSKNGFLNPSSLRFADELVRHKILDFLGDISLLKRRVIGHFVILCGGHTAHIDFFKKLKKELIDVD